MYIHPAVLIFFSINLFLVLMVYSNPLIIFSIVLFFILLGLTLDKKEELKKILKWSIITMGFIIIINPIFSNSGKTIILRLYKIPIIGSFKITLESILYGINMAFKFLAISLIFFGYGILVNQDDAFTFFSKYFNKLTLTVSMTVNIIHKLRLEVTRVKEVLILRGVSFNDKSLFKRTKAYYFLLKVIFITSLEGSFDRAETLFARDYGKFERSNYKNLRILKKDKYFIFSNILLFIIAIYGIFNKLGSFKFYPKVTSLTKEMIYFSALFNLVLFSKILLLKGANYESNKG